MSKATVLCIANPADGLLRRKSLLEQSGYTVLMSDNPSHALELLQSLSVDAVIVGALPQADTGKFTARIKQLRPNVPLIVIATPEAAPQSALPHVDVIYSSSQPGHKLVEAVRESLGSRAFFLRWLRAWKSRAAV